MGYLNSSFTPGSTTGRPWPWPWPWQWQCPPLLHLLLLLLLLLRRSKRADKPPTATAEPPLPLTDSRKKRSISLYYVGHHLRGEYNARRRAKGLASLALTNDGFLSLPLRTDGLDESGTLPPNGLTQFVLSTY